MRLSAILLTLAVIASGQAPVSDKGVIEGKVVNLRGEPLRKTTVRLRAMRPQSPGLITTTDSQGNFVFEGLDPSIYSLSAEHPGYLRQNYGVRTPGILGNGLEIRAGTRKSDVVITMTPQGVIAGKVTDEDGDLVTGVLVHIYQVHWFNNTRQIQSVASSSLLPDGTFVVGNLMPGQYYVGASGSNDRSNDLGWMPTYFPDTTDFSSASRIEVSPGADIRGIDLRARRGAVFQIHGTVTGAPTRNVRLVLISRGLGPRTSLPYALELPPGGDYSFSNVVPGSYTIMGELDPRGGEASSNPLVAYSSVTVSDRDVTGVAMSFGPALEIAGTVRMEDGSTPPEPVSIQTIEYDPLLGQENVESDDKGNFHLGKLLPQRYRVEVHRPFASYIESVRFAGRDITLDNLDLTSDMGGAMEIVLSPNAASVAGVVRDKDGNPAPFAIIELWSASLSELPQAPVADSNGSFEFSNLKPGDYRIAAWDTVDVSLLQNPDFLARFEASAKKVSLRESAKPSVEVTVNDRETTAAEVAKLP